MTFTTPPPSTSSSSSTWVKRVGQACCGFSYRIGLAFDRSFLRGRVSHMIEAHLGKWICLALILVMIGIAAVHKDLTKLGWFYLITAGLWAVANSMFLQLVPEFQKTERVALIRAKKLLLLFLVSFLFLFPLLVTFSSFFGLAAFHEPQHSPRVIEFVKTPPTGMGAIISREKEDAVVDTTPTHAEKEAKYKDLVRVEDEQQKQRQIQLPLLGEIVGGEDDVTHAGHTEQPLDAEIRVENESEHEGHASSNNEAEESEDKKEELTAHVKGGAKPPIVDSIPHIPAEPLEAGIHHKDENESALAKLTAIIEGEVEGDASSSEKEPLDAAIRGGAKPIPLEGDIMGGESLAQHAQHSVQLEGGIEGGETPKQHDSHTHPNPVTLEAEIEGGETPKQHDSHTHPNPVPLEAEIEGGETPKQHDSHSHPNPVPLQAEIESGETPKQHDSHSHPAPVPLNAEIESGETPQQHEQHSPTPVPLEAEIEGGENPEQHAAHSQPSTPSASTKPTPSSSKPTPPLTPQQRTKQSLNLLETLKTKLKTRKEKEPAAASKVDSSQLPGANEPANDAFIQESIKHHEGKAPPTPADVLEASIEAPDGFVVGGAVPVVPLEPDAHGRHHNRPPKHHDRERVGPGRGQPKGRPEKSHPRRTAPGRPQRENNMHKNRQRHQDKEERDFQKRLKHRRKRDHHNGGEPENESPQGQPTKPISDKPESPFGFELTEHQKRLLAAPVKPAPPVAKVDPDLAEKRRLKREKHQAEQLAKRRGDHTPALPTTIATTATTSSTNEDKSASTPLPQPSPPTPSSSPTPSPSFPDPNLTATDQQATRPGQHGLGSRQRHSHENAPQRGGHRPHIRQAHAPKAKTESSPQTVTQAPTSKTEEEQLKEVEAAFANSTPNLTPNHTPL